MARLDGKFLRGVIGPNVMKRYRDKQIVTIKPHFSMAHLTQNSIRSAKTFGLSSTLAKYVKLCFTPIISRNTEGTLFYKLSAALLYCLNLAKNTQTQNFEFEANSFNSLVGFEFNADSPVKRNFLIQPVINVSGQIFQIQVPEILVSQDIRFPKNATLCKLVSCVGMFDLASGRFKLSEPQTLDIPYSYNSVIIPPHDFMFGVTPGCLCIAVISLQYFETTFVGTVGINNKAFNPCAVLSAFISGGSVDPAVTDQWQKMSVKF